MFNNKTLLIVGAGASREANLPTGRELKNRIADLLDIRFGHRNERKSGDGLTFDALTRKVKRSDHPRGDVTPYLNACWRIREAMPQAISIDNFIDAHSSDDNIVLCGKLAIVRSILEAEMHSLLYFDTTHGNAHPNYQSLDRTWYNSFMQLLTESCGVDKLPQRLSSVSFVIFNYDRCIEHFLYYSLQTYYGISEDKAAELVRSIEIYHPYGTVGYLPWQQANGAVDFGADPHANQLLALASQIKTFAEGTDPDASQVVAIRQKVTEANIIIFLGFAFHRMNLELLRPTDSPAAGLQPAEYFATAHGISSNDCEIIKSDLAKLRGIEPKSMNLRNDLACNQLLQEYWRSLSLS